MVWYVAVVAILNFGLGYALAVVLGSGRGKIALATGDLADVTEPAELES